MSTKRIIFLALFASMLLVNNIVVAEEWTKTIPNEQSNSTTDKPVTQQAVSETQKSANATTIQYIPPLRGAPKTRVGGATRGEQSKTLRLTVLAPEETSYTSKDQPVLYWYISQTTQTPIEFTIIAEQAIEPLLETRLIAPVAPGMQNIKLRDFQIHLQPNTEYQWTVALITNNAQRSQDILSTGTLLYTPISETLKIAVKNTETQQAAEIYAQNGYWYDALELLVRDNIKPAQLKALFSQAGLSGIMP